MTLELACCGNDCNACPRYVATRSADIERLKKAARLWVNIGWRDRVASPEEMACPGCRMSEWCRYGIRECAQQKNVSHCGTCDSYPCGKVGEAFQRTERYALICRERCSQEDYRNLRKAFFLKKENLEIARASKR